MKNHKVVRLLQEGFRFETLKMLNESQINTLYGKVISEQSITDATKKAKEELAGLNKMVDNVAKKIASEEDNIEDNDALGDLAMQTDTGQETPHDEKDMAPDGMDDDSDNNRSTMGEEDKKKTIRQIEESLVNLIRKHIPSTMSKKDLINLVENGTKEAPTKTPVKTPSKPDRKTPYQPKHKPAPKAEMGEQGTKEAPTKTPVKTPSKPDRKTPYQPKHKPAPKAEKEKNRSSVELPSFLKFDELNIQFKDEKTKDNN
jgi:hypothetical protein